MCRYGVIAIGYNRVNGMQRLLDSLEKSYYEEDEVVLIVSVDNSGSNDVVNCANEFEWTHGAKRVVTYSQRQGLRKHILNCGNFVNEFDAIAVFEDDIVVAPGWYKYMKCAVEKYSHDERIAGISLYNYTWNENVALPFEAALSDSDVYFVQTAQSWGQVWMREQWLDFMKWYNEHNDEFEPQDNIPEAVSSWPKSSWKKFHIKYCVEADKYFVYPYKSLTTCFADVGEHSYRRDTYTQVATLDTVKMKYNMPDFGDTNSVKYDVFFERVLCDGKFLDISYKDICVDLYGSKRGYECKRYLLTTKAFSFKLVGTFGMLMKPHEVNFLNRIEGHNIFLYDTTAKGELHNVDEVAIFRYRYDLYDHTRILSRCIFDSWKYYLKGFRKNK